MLVAALLFCIFPLPCTLMKTHKFLPPNLRVNSAKLQRGFEEAKHIRCSSIIELILKPVK